MKGKLPAFLLLFLFTTALSPASAQDQHCDSAFQNCRTPLIQLIRNERIGIDVAQWFSKDSYVITELIKRHQAGVPVRFIVDRRAEPAHPGSQIAIDNMRAAGMPLREKRSGGIVHWKLFIFAGQQVVKFGAANLTPSDYLPTDPYKNYRNETHIIDRQQVDSFKTKFEDKWLSSSLADYANMTDAARVRRYPVFPIDSTHLSFQPEDSFSSRLVALIDAETMGIDVSILRLGLPSLTDALIRAHRRGVRVRVNSEQTEYRVPERYQHAIALDKLYASGVQVRWRAHNGQNHEKTALFHARQVLWTGSSNWVSSSDRGGNMEHNYFTDPTQTDWWDHYAVRFGRRWDNLQFVNGIRVLESQPFVPQSPGKAKYISPVHASAGSPTALVFNGGYFGVYADVYFGTASNPPLYQANVPLSVNAQKSVPLPALVRGNTYYWKVVNKTFAHRTSIGPIYSFVAQ